MLVVDQPVTVEMLVVAQDMGVTVGYLLGASMRRIAGLTPGSAKSDVKDAAVIAGTARTTPQLTTSHETTHHHPTHRAETSSKGGPTPPLHIIVSSE